MSRATLLCAAFLLGSTDLLLAQEAQERTTTAGRSSRAPQAQDTVEPRALAPQITEAVRAEYRRRAATLEATGGSEDTLGRRLDLALWCQQQGLQAETNRQAEAVLQRDPEHATAHQLLGHELVDGKWLTREAAMQARGYVLYRGKWLRKYDAAVLQGRADQTRAQERERARLERELNEHFGHLASSSSAARDQALRQIEAVAENCCWPDLAVLARKQKAIYDTFWRQHSVTATVQAQHSELLSMEPFTTSLGTGSPVRLQLPRLRTTSIATTVTLPAGTGR